MPCEKEKHLFEYVWAGQYRRCTKKGCSYSEWWMGSYWYRGLPCGISQWHSLSSRATGLEEKRKAGALITIESYKRASKNPSLSAEQRAGYVKSAKQLEDNLATAKGTFNPKEMEKEIEQNWFLRQKQRAKDAQ